VAGVCPPWSFLESEQDSAARRARITRAIRADFTGASSKNGGSGYHPGYRRESRASFRARTGRGGVFESGGSTEQAAGKLIVGSPRSESPPQSG
jgi:hypothetical protein